MSFIQINKKAVLIGSAVIILLAAVWVWMTPDKVPAYSMTRQDYVPSLLLSGEVTAKGNTVLSTLSSGKVIKCPVQAGDNVKRDQLLVQIDDTQALIDRDRAAAAVQIARSELQKAASVSREEARSISIQADIAKEKSQLEYARIKALAEAGGASAADLEQAEQNLRVNEEKANSARAALLALTQGGSSIMILQAQLQQMQLDLAEKQIAVKQMRILAPADGVLLDLYVRPGETVASGSQVAVLAAGRELRIKIQPDQRYASLAGLGNQAKIWLTNQADTKWDSTVVYREPVGNAEQGSFTAELELSQPVAKLYPGQLVSVQLFGVAAPAALILPENYLTAQDGQNGVWLAVNNRAKFTSVKSGLFTSNGVVIEAGLKEGDIVLQPAGLQENQKVTPLLQED
ncbi:MAG: efflux RND transporter periplasmic adaptor subunit [Ignavibacteriales bacterium]